MQDNYEAEDHDPTAADAAPSTPSSTRKRGRYRKQLYPDSGHDSMSRYTKKKFFGHSSRDNDTLQVLSQDEEYAAELSSSDTSRNSESDDEIGIMSAGTDDGSESEVAADYNENEQQLHDDSDASDSGGSDCEYQYVPTGTATFEKLQKFIELSENVTSFTIKYSTCEIIMLVLTLALTHNLSLSATCDILGLLNFLCCTTLFPSTRKMFKPLFNPNHGMVMHYCCEFCGHYLGTKGDEKIKKCRNNSCEKNNDLDGYKYEHTFITLDVQMQIKEIIENDKLKFIFDKVSNNDDQYSDICDGSMHKAFFAGHDIKPSFLTCTFNCDAAPVAKNSKSQIVPIFLMINELDYQCRSDNLILAGVWYGETKPRMDVFLTPFTDMMNSLSRNGIDINTHGIKKNIKVLATCCCVDTVARAPMQGLVGVNGYNCCSWCMLKGEQVEGTVKYPLKMDEIIPRTEENFKMSCNSYAQNRITHNGIKSLSPLLNLSYFSMVWGFVPDYMHCLLLGIAKRFLEIWLAAVGHASYIGTPNNILIMDQRLQSILPPTYLKRLPTLLSLRKFMKAKEFENWFLFYSVVVLKDILPEKFLSHWKLLVKAINMLLQDTVTKNEINEAELMLYEFVYKCERLYGKYECTYNMHQLLHVAESVRRWGPLWAHTAYPFEGSIGSVKKILKNTRGIPHQICRNIELYRARNFMSINFSVSSEVLDFCEKIQDCPVLHFIKTNMNETLFGDGKKYTTIIADLESNFEYTEFNKIVKDGVTYEKHRQYDDRKINNTYVELDDGKIGQIKHILLQSNTKKCFIVLRKILLQGVAEVSHIKQIRGFGRKIVVPSSLIKNIAVYMKVNATEYVATIPKRHFALNL